MEAVTGGERKGMGEDYERSAPQGDEVKALGILENELKIDSPTRKNSPLPRMQRRQNSGRQTLSNKRPNTIASYFLVAGMDWEGSHKENGPISMLDLLDPQFCSGLKVRIHDRYPKQDYVDMSVGDQIVPFCFPIGVSILNKKSRQNVRQVTCHSFTLTREDHSKIYATCLTFYDPIAKKSAKFVDPTLEQVTSRERRRGDWATNEFKRYLSTTEDGIDAVVWLQYCQQLDTILNDLERNRQENTEASDDEPTLNKFLFDQLRSKKESFINLMGEEYVSALFRIVRRRNETLSGGEACKNDTMEDLALDGGRRRSQSEVPRSTVNRESFLSSDGATDEDDDNTSVPSLVSFDGKDSDDDTSAGYDGEAFTSSKTLMTMPSETESLSGDQVSSLRSNSDFDLSKGKIDISQQSTKRDSDEMGPAQDNVDNFVFEDDDDPSQSCKEIRLAALQALTEYYSNFVAAAAETLDLYEPKCIVLMSPWPMYTLFEAVLREVLSIVRKKVALPVPLERCIMHLVREVPEPPPGKYRVRFKLHDSQPYFFSCSRPPLNRLPLLNVPLRPIFESLCANHLVTLFTATILEYKIVFVSDHLDLLSKISTGLQALLFPLTWQNPFIPILPNYPEMMEILHAPLAIMVGIHRSQLGSNSDFKSSVVFVDLDNNLVQLPSNDPGFPVPPCCMTLGDRLRKLVYGNTNTVPLEPQSSAMASARERRGSRRRRNRTDFMHASSRRNPEDGPVTDFLEEDITPPQHRLESVADAPVQEFNNAVRKVFLEFFVNLIGDYRPFMGGFESGLDELIDRKAFILNHEGEKMQQFLDLFVSTQMMQMFFEDRIFAAERNFEIMLFDAWIDMIAVHKVDTSNGLASPVENGTSEEDGMNGTEYMESKHTIKASFLADTSQADRQNYDVPTPNANEEYEGAGPFKICSTDFPLRLSWRGLPKPKVVPSLIRVRRGSHLLRDANKVSHVLESVYLNFYTKQRLFKARFQFVKRHALSGLEDVRVLTEMLEHVQNGLLTYKLALHKLCRRMEANQRRQFGFDTSLEPNPFLKEHIWDNVLSETIQLADIMGELGNEISTEVCSPLREKHRSLKSQYNGLFDSEKTHMNNIILRKASMERAKKNKEDATKISDEAERHFIDIQERLKQQNMERALTHQNPNTRRFLNMSTTPRFDGDLDTPMLSPATANSEIFSPRSPFRMNGSPLLSPPSDRLSLLDGDRSILSADSNTSADREWYKDDDEDLHEVDHLDADLDGMTTDDITPNSMDENILRGFDDQISPAKTLSGQQEPFIFASAGFRDDSTASLHSASYYEPRSVESREWSGTQSAKASQLRKGSRRSSFFARSNNGTSSNTSGKFRRSSDALGLMHGVLSSDGFDSIMTDVRNNRNGKVETPRSADGKDSEFKKDKLPFVRKHDLTKIADRKVAASRNLESCRLEFAQEVAALERELTNFTNANTEIMETFHKHELSRITKVQMLLRKCMDIFVRYLSTKRLDTIARLELALNEPCLFVTRSSESLKRNVSSAELEQVSTGLTPVIVDDELSDDRESVKTSSTPSTPKTPISHASSRSSRPFTPKSSEELRDIPERTRHRYPYPESLPQLSGDAGDSEIEKVYDAWLNWFRSACGLYASGSEFGSGRVLSTRELTAHLSDITSNLEFGKNAQRAGGNVHASTLQAALSSVRDCVVLIAGIISKESEKMHQTFVSPSAALQQELRAFANQKEEDRLEMRRKVQNALAAFKRAETALANKEEQKESVIKELVRSQEEAREIAMKMEGDTGSMALLSPTGSASPDVERKPSLENQVSTLSGTGHGLRGTVKSVLKTTDADKFQRAQKKQERLAQKIAQLANEQSALQEAKDRARAYCNDLTESYRKTMLETLVEFEDRERYRVERSISNMRELVDEERVSCSEMVDSIEERVITINKVSPDFDLRRHEELDKRTRRYLQNALDPFAKSSSLTEFPPEIGRSSPFVVAATGGGVEGFIDVDKSDKGMDSRERIGSDGMDGTLAIAGSLSRRGRHSSIHSVASEPDENRLTFAKHMTSDLGTILARFNQLSFRLRTMQHFALGYSRIQKRAFRDFEKLTVQLDLVPLDILRKRAETNPFDDLFVKTFGGISIDIELLTGLVASCRNLSTKVRMSKRTLKSKMLVHVKKKRKYDLELESAKDKVRKAKELSERLDLETELYEGEVRNKRLDPAQEKKLFDLRDLKQKAGFRLAEAKDLYQTKKVVNSNCFSQLLEQMQAAYTESLNSCHEFLQEFVVTVQLRLAAHASRNPFLEPPPNGLETADPPIYFDVDSDAVLDLAAMDSSGFFDTMRPEQPQKLVNEVVVIGVDSKRTSVERGFTVGGQGYANNLKTAFTPVNSAFVSLAKVLSGDPTSTAAAKGSLWNERPTRYDQVQNIILHSKAICDSLLEIYPERINTFNTMFSAALELTLEHPLLCLSEKTLNQIASSLDTTPRRRRRDKIFDFGKKLRGRIRGLATARTSSSFSSKGGDDATAEEIIHDAIKTIDVQAASFTSMGEVGKFETVLSLPPTSTPAEGEDESELSRRFDSDHFEDSKVTVADDLSPSSTISSTCSDDRLAESANNEMGTVLEDQEFGSENGSPFVDLEEADLDCVEALRELLGNSDRLGQETAKSEISTLFRAMEGIRNTWTEHLNESLQCLVSSDQGVITSLQDMSLTCQSTLNEIQTIRSKVKREWHIVQSNLNSASDQVADAKRLLQECKVKDFHKNFLTMERGEDRKKRKIHSAERKFEAALSSMQDAKDKYVDYQRFYKKEAARVMRIYDDLERLQYAFLSGLYNTLSFWHTRLRDKLQELSSASLDTVNSVDLHADVQNFIESNRSPVSPLLPGEVTSHQI